MKCIFFSITDMASSSHCADQDRDGDTDSVKVETEDTKPTVPSLLDLSFTPKGEIEFKNLLPL